MYPLFVAEKGVHGEKNYKGKILINFRRRTLQIFCFIALNTFVRDEIARIQIIKQ